MYLWGTWHDEPVAEILLGAANLPAKMLVGPGGHCETPPGLSIVDEQRRFFDHYLKGVDNGIEREPRYAYITLNAPKDSAWTQSNQLPGVGAKATPLFLAGGPHGDLGLARPAAGKTGFTVDYDVGPPDAFAFWPGVMDDKGLTFTTPPLDRPLTVRGHPVVRLKVATSTPEAFVFAYLEDVAPDGKVEVISHGRLAASQRKVSTKAPYDTMGLPWHSGLKADAAPMTPGKAEDLVFDLLPTSIIFQPGHRLRLTLAGADGRQRNLESVKMTPPPVLTVSLGGADGSTLSLPVVGEGPKFR
jgi:predicted acyl esterase